MNDIIKLMADGLIVVVVIVGAIGWFSKVKGDYYQIYGRALAAALTAMVVAKIFSLFYDSGARPFIEQGVRPGALYMNNPGFPSDHALLVWTITFIVWAQTKSWRLALSLAILSVLVCVGRILALVHTPLDILGGFLAALIGVSLWYGADLFSLKKK